MKMVYERPMLQAELFVTNAYCGACKDNPTPNTGVMIVDPANGTTNWFSGVNTDRDPWTTTPYDPDDVKNYDLTHTFDSGDRTTMINPNSHTTQWYWTCNCESHSDGSKTGSYYLEYSSHWTEEIGKQTFILYKEDYQSGKLNIAGGSSLPNGGDDSDIAVVGVTFTNPILNFS